MGNIGPRQDKEIPRCRDILTLGRARYKRYGAHTAHNGGTLSQTQQFNQPDDNDDDARKFHQVPNPPKQRRLRQRNQM